MNKDQQSGELFRLLVEGVKDYAIFMLDPEGRVATWNAGAERIKGYAAEEIVGQHFSASIPQEAIDARLARARAAAGPSGGPVRGRGLAGPQGRLAVLGQRRHHRPATTRRRLRGFAKVTRDLTERKRVEMLEEADRRKDEFLAMLAHELRNPLAPIRNALSVMRLSGGDEPAVEPGADDDRAPGRRTWSGWSTTCSTCRRITPAARSTSSREPLDARRGRDAARVETRQPLIDARGHELTVALPGRAAAAATATRPGWPRSAATCSTTPPSTRRAGGHIRLTRRARQGTRR